MKIYAIIPALSLCLLMTSCDSKSPEAAPAPSESSQSAKLMEEKFTEIPAEQFVTIEEARQTPANEAVTVKGTLLGREHIFVDKAAMFLIGDPDKIEIEDHEEHAWSGCCTPQEVKNLHTMTVQFVDGEGNLIMETAKGVKGLKELDQVVISGKMDASSTPEAPVLNIEQISIVK